MSWVRWSSEVSKGISSDLYIYDHCDGYVAVHIAGRKRKSLKPLNEIPDEPDLGLISSNFNEWSEKNKNVENFWDEDKEGINWNWEYLPEKWAGQNLDFVDMGSLIETLKEMRNDGIVFPDYIFETAENSREEYDKEN